MKEPLIRTLIKEALKEAELSIGKDNTNFGIRVDLGNPQSETKRGIRIKLIPRGVMLDPGKRGELESAIMTKFNEALKEIQNIEGNIESRLVDQGGYGMIDGSSIYSQEQQEKDIFFQMFSL